MKISRIVYLNYSSFTSDYFPIGRTDIINYIGMMTGNKVATEVGGLFVKCDVTNEAAVANLYKVAFDTYNRIDIAFNNAGISPPDDDSILITPLDAWERVLKVNTTSVFLCCKAVLPYILLP